MMTVDSRSLTEDGNVQFNDVDETIFVPEPIKEEERLAGFWIRFAAYIIDAILISSISGIILSPLMLVNDGYPIEISAWTLNGIIATLIYYVYYLLMTKFFQQTLGKMIVGIKVISTANRPLTWQDAFFRETIGRIIHNAFFILKLLYLMVAFTNNKQGIHDMIGNTKVVYI